MTRLYLWCVTAAITPVTTPVTISLTHVETDVGNDTAAIPPERGRALAAQGAWHEAYAVLSEADSRYGLGPDDLALLADVAYASGHLDATITAWERAHAMSLEAGDRVAAAHAAVRVAMYLLFDTALMAPVRAWLRRAERLLHAEEPNPVTAWHAVVRSYERLLSGDFRAAMTWARRAVDIGASCDPSAVALGGIVTARLLILKGRVDEGLELLDETALAAVSGELDPLLTGVVFCEVVCALQALAQYDRAEEWTAMMEHWRLGQPVGSIHGRCRVHRAEILRLHGAYAEAEEEALRACEELRPYLRRELGWPLAELGRIRLLRKNLPGAQDAFAEADAIGWDPQPGLALMQLARGDIRAATGSIHDAIERPRSIPSKEFPPGSALRRALLRGAQVEIDIAAGNVDGAAAGAADLAQMATTFQSKGFLAGARLAEGRVLFARGDAGGARVAYEEAMRLWTELGAPYEAATARLGLADVLRVGSVRQADMEVLAARPGPEEVATTQRITNIDGVLDADVIGDQAPISPGSGSDSDLIFRCEGEYWSITFHGRTVVVRDLKGLHYLSRLLAAPDRQFHVLDLTAAEGRLALAGGRGDVDELSVSSTSHAGDFLDAQAKDAYRRRLTEIEEDIEEARASADDSREAQAQAEWDFLTRELSRAFGLGNRHRRAGDTSERARAAVTRAMRQAIKRLGQHNPELEEHLGRTIRTGTYCLYSPERGSPKLWKQ